MPAREKQWAQLRWSEHIMMRVLLSVMLLLMAHIPCAHEIKPHYTIGTGSKEAAYYPVGTALCEVINENALPFSCAAISTEGSVYNLNAIKTGAHPFGISQGSMQYKAYLGLDEFKAEGINPDLRTVIPLHVETMLLAVKKDSGIHSFEDLKGKRVNIGNEGSGTRAILERLFAHKNMALSAMEARSFKSGELPDRLCNGSLDAAIYSTGHPNGIYKKMIEECDVLLVDLWDEDIAAFVKANPEFIPAQLPAHTYSGQNTAVQGFGIQTVLSVSVKIPAEHIETLIKTIRNHREKLVEKHPIFASISFDYKESSRLAPYHKGALQYFRK